jgi:hypothetical protein
MKVACSPGMLRELDEYKLKFRGNYSAAENYRNITLRAVMIFYSPIGSRDSKIS